MIAWERQDLPALARAFRAARPFGHAILDDLLPAAEHRRVAAEIEEEPHVLLENDLYMHLRGREPPLRPRVCALRDELVSLTGCARVAEICGRRLSRGDGASYAYLEGHYLLPHSDAAVSEGRAVAYAYYVSAPEKGGELELFSCTEGKGGELTRTRPARRIEPRANRLVLFEVTGVALHQVREVTRGARRSIAGWFYP